MLVGALVAVLLVDLFTPESSRGIVPQVAGIGLLASVVPVLTLAVDGPNRAMFGGAYAVDDFSLVLKALFLAAGYVVVLLSTNYIAEGDYHEGEYYFLLLSSILGMSIMASSRDLLSIFVALELLSIPAYMLAGWRKRDPKCNEAGVKYYLMGVFASAMMLYGMSLLYGLSGSTLLTDIGAAVSGPETTPFLTLGVLFVLIGFAFKVSAVPFHTWAPDTYEGAPTPITAFLAVSSKAAGFVALLQLVAGRLPRPGRRRRAALVGAGRPDDDRRQPHRPAPDQHRPPARLLGHRPGRLHAGAPGGRWARTPTAPSRPSSPTC